MTPQEALTRVIEHREIFREEMLSLMRGIMSGEVSPVLIAAIESTAILLSGRPISEAGLWFRLLAGFDIIFTVLCWLLFGYVIEE